MAGKRKGKTNCDVCMTTDCLNAYTAGKPDHCPANRYEGPLRESEVEFRKPEVRQIQIASRIVTTKGIAGNWPRIQDGIEFAKQMEAQKIGIATCVAFIRDAKDIAQLFEGAGFDVICVGCHVGGIRQAAFGIPEEWWGPYPSVCNPIAQAGILNQEATDLNFMLGLCVGHDALFGRYSQAPVITLAVKDRAAANNPVAALHTWSYRQRLFREYCGKEVGYTR